MSFRSDPRPTTYTELSEAYDEVRARLAEAEGLLREFLRLLDKGDLIRNIEHDSEPGWSVRMLPLVKFLGSIGAFLRERAKG